MCVNPLTLKQDNKTNTVPCGRCFQCIKRMRNQWAIRLEQELKYSKEAYFVTLTYHEDFIPLGNKDIPSLSKLDAQKMIKSLRKRTKKKGIKYFLVGEYGEKSFRPHYHVLLFNTGMNRLETQKYLLESWQKGTIDIGTVTEASIRYCTKYIIQTYEVSDWVEPPFRLMSNGIGRGYLDSLQLKKYHKRDLSRDFITKQNGTKHALPRYYKEKLYTKRERELQNIKRNTERLDKEKEHELKANSQHFRNKLDQLEAEKRVIKKGLKLNSKI